MSYIYKVLFVILLSSKIYGQATELDSSFIFINCSTCSDVHIFADPFELDIVTPSSDLIDYRMLLGSITTLVLSDKSWPTYLEIMVDKGDTVYVSYDPSSKLFSFTGDNANYNQYAQNRNSWINSGQKSKESSWRDSAQLHLLHMAENSLEDVDVLDEEERHINFLLDRTRSDSIPPPYDACVLHIAYKQWIKQHFKNRRLSVRTLKHIEDLFKHQLLKDFAFSDVLRQRMIIDVDIDWEMFERFKSNISGSYFKSSVENAIDMRLNAISGIEQLPIFDVNDHEYALSSIEAEIIYVDIWATHCAPCIKEHKALNQLVKRFQGNAGIAFVSLSEDQDVQRWKEYLKDNELITRNYIISKDLLRAKGVLSKPRYLIIRPDGTIVRSFASRPTRESLYRELNEMLNPGLDGR